MIGEYEQLYDQLAKTDWYIAPEEIARMIPHVENLNVKKLRKFCNDINEKYRHDHKEWMIKKAKVLEQFEKEMKEELAHYYEGLMYVLFIIAMKETGLADRTVKIINNKLAGTLNDLENDVITVADIKTFAKEKYGFEVKFDAKRHFIPSNFFEDSLVGVKEAG